MDEHILIRVLPLSECERSGLLDAQTNYNERISNQLLLKSLSKNIQTFDKWGQQQRSRAPDRRS
jgi:hypothetical protein